MSAAVPPVVPTAQSFRNAVSQIGAGLGVGVSPYAGVSPPAAKPAETFPPSTSSESNFLKSNWKTVVGITAAVVALVIVVVVVIKVRSGMRKKQAEEGADGDDDDDMPVVGRPPSLQPIPNQYSSSGPAAAAVDTRYPAPGERQPSIRSLPRQMPLGGVDASQGAPHSQGPLSFQSRPAPYEGAAASAGQKLSPMDMAEMSVLQEEQGEERASPGSSQEVVNLPLAQAREQPAQAPLDQFHAQPAVKPPAAASNEDAGFTPL